MIKAKFHSFTVVANESIDLITTISRIVNTITSAYIAV